MLVRAVPSLLLSLVVSSTVAMAAPIETSTSQTTYQQQVDQSVMTFELYRRLFLKLSEHCDQALAMDDVDIAEMTMLMKDKVGISYLQYTERLFTPEQIREISEKELSDWTRQYPDCTAVSFKIAYRSAQKQVTQAMDVLRTIPVIK